MRARLTDNLVGKLASKVILDGLCLGCAFDCTFQLIKQLGQVLFDIHLLNHVDWVAVPVLEGMAVALGIHVHLLRQEQTCEESLPLQKHVVLIRLVVIVRVLNLQHIVPEARYHEQLLVQTIHVANASQVFYADVSRLRLLIIVESNVPVGLFGRSPRCLLVEME